MELKKDSKSSSNRQLKVLIKFEDRKVTAKLKNIPEVKIASKTAEVITASVPVSKILNIAAIKGVEYMDLAQALEPERGPNG